MRGETPADYRPSSYGDLTEVGLAFKATPLAEVFKGRLPTAAELRNMNEEFGVELATAIFLKTLEMSRLHGEFERRMRALDPKDAADRLHEANSVEVLVVASNLYQSGRQWGDHVDSWRAWARESGFQTEVIETDPRATIDGNARLIRDHLANRPHPCRILVTYGQGTSEFRYFLQRRSSEEGMAKARATELAGLRGWVNVCGSFSGASSSRSLQQGGLRRLATAVAMRWAGRNPQVLEETSPGYLMWKRPAPIPDELVVTSVIGLPLRSQIPRGLHVLYSRLAKKFPNDGVVSVVEAMAQRGFVVAVPGMSHRAEDAKLKPVLQRTLLLMANSVATRPNPSVAQPG
jgi:hypothetical protein